LAPLAAYKQFLCYVLVPSKTKPGKMDKFPVSPVTGEVVDAHNPAHWVDAETACRTATAWGPSYGVAFSLQTTDPFFFIDLDNHYENGQWSPLAIQMVQVFKGAAFEVSQSGTGGHIIGMGTAPPHGCRNEFRRMEFYTERRFIALTGINATGNAATDHTPALHSLVVHLFPVGAARHDGEYVLTAAPVAEWRGPQDDDDLIRRALKSQSAGAAFGSRANFADLWDKNVEVLSKAFPSSTAPYGESEADAALAAHLAFWTGKHGERIERLMRRSGLVRDKWDRSGDNYLLRTICEIVGRGGDVLQDTPPEPAALPLASTDAPTQRLVSGSTFLNVEAQQNLFKGCVYIRSTGKILVPGGRKLTPEKFNVEFGGYTFAMDDVNEKVTHKAFDAFTQSRSLRAPLVDETCFKPDAAPGAIFNVAGRTSVNTWWAPIIERQVGDITPFMTHLRLLLPDERDQLILLSYMAACVQYKGFKFSWCPVKRRGRT
jgi:hypothetical protein